MLRVRSPDVLDLIDADAPVERLATGFVFTEGPVWSPAGYLLFYDLLAGSRFR